MTGNIYREKSNHDLRHSQLLATYFDTQVFDSQLAADAIEMQQKREQFHCDLLVLDVNMPGEDGISSCRRLRAEVDKTSIVILTARNDVVDNMVRRNVQGAYTLRYDTLGLVVK